jgi:hypothetical protein
MAEKQSAFGKAQSAKARERATEAEQAWTEAEAEAKATEDKTARLKALRQERDRKEAAETPAPKKRGAPKPKIRRGKSSY